MHTMSVGDILRDNTNRSIDFGYCYKDEQSLSSIENRTESTRREKRTRNAGEAGLEVGEKVALAGL